jgi:hypothetical protein
MRGRCRRSEKRALVALFAREAGPSPACRVWTLTSSGVGIIQMSIVRSQRRAWAHVDSPYLRASAPASLTSLRRSLNEGRRGPVTRGRRATVGRASGWRARSRHDVRKAARDRRRMITRPKPGPPLSTKGGSPGTVNGAATYGAGQETAGASDTSGVFGFCAPHSMPMWPVCGAVAGGPTDLPAASFG